jgi:hypothetical protein
MKTRTRRTWVCAALILACVISGVSALGQAGAKPAGGATHTGSGSEIRRVDFRNFTFGRTMDGATIQIRNGKFQTQDEDYGISRIIYGDLNADGHEAAVVIIGIDNKVAANPSLAYYENQYVYAMKKGKPTLLATIDQNQIYRDVQSSLNDPDQMCNEELGTPAIRSIAYGALVVDATGGGRFCSKPDKYNVTLRYRWDGTRFVLAGKPMVRLSKN